MVEGDQNHLMCSVCTDNLGVNLNLSDLRIVIQCVLINKKCTVHEHNHTRILVSEVLCSLGGQDTENVSETATADGGDLQSHRSLLDTFTLMIINRDTFSQHHNGRKHC